MSRFLPACEKAREAFTLLEMMMVLAIVSVLMLVSQDSILKHHQMALQKHQASVQQTDVQRFLMMFKTELLQAGYALGSSGNPGIEIVDQHHIIFRADRNKDGDLEDTREKIAYRFDSDSQSLKRKSGNASFQILIESVQELTFDASDTSDSFCIDIKIKTEWNSKIQEHFLCPLVL